MENLKLVIMFMAYLSLLIELVFFPVPSVASTYQLVIGDKAQSKTKNALHKIKNWQAWKKTFFLFIPLILNLLVFIFPVFYLLGMVRNEWITHHPIAFWIGLLLVIFGRCITFFSVIQIRKINKGMDQQKFLHQKGWFRWSRNPGLIGMYLFIFGVWILYSHPIFLMGILFYIIYMHYKVLLEEDYLMGKFEEDYQKYTKETKRYL